MIASLAHPSILESTRLHWPHEADAGRWAKAMADAWLAWRQQTPGAQPMVLTLTGPLGAGKTTFARAFLRALGVQGRIKSPTYALLEPYEVQGLQIAHLDLYRLQDEREFESAGLDDALRSHDWVMVEWAERAPKVGARADLDLCIEGPDLNLGASLSDPGPTSRQVQVSVQSPQGAALLARMLP